MEYRKPERVFERTGTVNPKSAYYVELENVVNDDNQDLKTIVENGRYFSIFAPRQSGKTTFFKRFCEKLETDATYIPILLSFQDVRKMKSDLFY